MGDIKILVRNRPWVILFFGAVLSLLNIAVRNGSIVYYFKYAVKDERATVWFFTFGSLAMIAGVISTRWLTCFFDKRNLLIALTWVNALLLSGFYFINPNQKMELQVLNALCCFLAGPSPVIVWSMYADSVDYGEWRFSRRTTGLIFSASLFAIKLGLTIGGALAGWVLGASGFVANTVQSPAALNGIRLMFSLFPAGLSALFAITMSFYPINDRQIEIIESDLSVRRLAAASIR